MTHKVGVVVFPGSNCDRDAFNAFGSVLNQEVEFLWHKDTNLNGAEIVVLPGGFSYGDYLRSGAIARFSPIMNEVIKFAESGGLVMGICNGFQVLVEAGLLPGALLRNANLKFACKQVYLRVETTKTPFTSGLGQGQILKVPIAHGDGNYYADETTLKSLQDNDRIVFKYSTSDGEITQEANPNGSILNIAGIVNKKRNVLGMMPHPERASEEILGSASGALVLKSVIETLN
ncbi:MAG: phosphoribosylformylglycinamidine synthase subunit PurQ [Bacteroidetes bacterium]|nr:phosphoribosylformylglycinamidine synthase subunit PurQ [Bacteroidota bacterium]MCL5737870.1 phosphoribosylformylglycinamidine synthase subunit PurQ [Bacteroidota bacterium]